MWDSVRTIQSSDQNVSKFVFEKPNAVVEAVLYKYPTYEERTVICCSVMSGCPIGCRFCGTGDYFVRNLTSEEIVAQVEECLKATGIDPQTIQRLQVMTMSMGEPLLNLKALIPALETLYSRYPKAALLISTSAPKVDYSEFMAAAKRIPTIGLQFSVHESTDAGRDKLIPFKNKLTLAEIAEQGEAFYNATGRTPYFNYCAHDGNTSDEDVARLVWHYDPAVFCATISVICERDESVAAANARQFKLANDFSSKMVTTGYNTRVFNPAGQDDIGGGCGQLWFVQDWMKQHPEMARPSIGNGLVKIHTPVEKKTAALLGGR
jgi:23S rRNA (adenine2503-C2)-methyltransferase